MVSWSDIVKNIYSSIEDIYIRCSKCSTPQQCVEELEPSTPNSIVVYRDCCACLLEQSLSEAGCKEMYIPINDSLATIYKLDDALIEIHNDIATVVPMNMVEEFIEMLRDLGYQDIDEILKFIEG